MSKFLFGLFMEILVCNIDLFDPNFVPENYFVMILLLVFEG